MDQQFVIEVFNLTKSFPGVIALDDINLKVRAGSVHCIIGENGAGKSTLVRALTGLYKSDAGRILIDGRDVSVHRAAHDLIACVPQEIDLFPNMTVAENLFMPFNKSGMKGPFVSKKMMNQRAKERLAEFHINVNPQEMVRNISIAHQQLLQIARAETQTGYKVLIMDEPTTSLTNLEIEVLFRIVKRLQSEGKTIIFISHKLEEMFAIGTHVSILRNGCLVGELPIEQVDSKWIVTKMSGEEIDIDEVFRPTVPGGDVVMKVQHLDGIR
ncbi:MAG: ATP-binding cassette domain-containing protein, partial [Candidatus Thiodiazotropha sp.]